MGGPVAEGGAEFGVELAVPEGACVWPTANLAERGPEVLLNFESAGGRPLTLVSNFPYELWLDGAFLGDGGHRCTPGEALADSWPEAAGARSVRVRLHWLDPERTVVFYRCLFDDPFFAELPPRDPWTCSHETSAAFGAKISGQLPRQTFTRSPAANEPLELGAAAPAMPWRVIASPIGRPRYVLVEPIRTRSDRLESHQRDLFRPTEAEDAAAYVREGRPCELRCDTFDLGRIAPHRFEVDTGPDACVLVYSEVGDFESAAGTPSRAKVRLADAVAAGVRGAAPFGTRGCRYVNVVYPEGGRPPAPRVWRREYPIRWKRVEVAPEDAAVVEACRANLVACVDGGLTDTCWRERAQWAGDVRMSSAAMGALADNPEVVDLALHQIAQSYDPETGMVNGAWPVGRPGMKFPSRLSTSRSA